MDKIDLSRKLDDLNLTLELTVRTPSSFPRQVSPSCHYNRLMVASLLTFQSLLFSSITTHNYHTKIFCQPQHFYQTTLKLSKTTSYFCKQNYLHHPLVVSVCPSDNNHYYYRAHNLEQSDGRSSRHDEADFPANGSQNCTYSVPIYVQ